MGGIEFHHHWLKGRTLGDPTGLDAYSIAAVAAKAGKMARPTPQSPNSPLSKIGYAFQFDAGRYARYLRGRAERQGARRTEGRIAAVECDGESGFVSAVVLESGARVEEGVAGRSPQDDVALSRVDALAAGRSAGDTR